MNGWTHKRPLREEISSAVIQGSGAAASIAGLVYLLVEDWSRQDGLGRAAFIVYGATMFVMFLASALYHGVPHARAKSVLQQIDHCMIFLLIAGTYTPIALGPLRHHGGVALAAAEWGLAVTGIILRLRTPEFFQRVAVPFYVVLGWLGVAWAAPIHRELGSVPILLMVAGGLSYTGGILFYRWHSQPFSNAMWHACVVAGSAWFFVAITRLLSVAPSLAQG